MPPTVNMGIPGATASAAHRGGKRVLLAEPAGYCAGVDRAVETSSAPWKTRGAGLRATRSCTTATAVDTLAQRGAIFVEETDEVPRVPPCSPPTVWPRPCMNRRPLATFR